VNEPRQLDRRRWELNWSRRLATTFDWYSTDPPDPLVELLGSGRIPSGPALDVGCGDGVLTRFIAGFHRPAVGMDIAIAAARKAMGQVTETNAVFVVGAAPELPFATGSFSFVFDRGCMHNMRPDIWGAYLADVDRVLRPGGMLELYYTGAVVGRTLSARMRTRYRQMRGRGKPRHLTVESLSALLPPGLHVAEPVRRFRFVSPQSGRVIPMERYLMERR